MVHAPPWRNPGADRVEPCLKRLKGKVPMWDERNGYQRSLGKHPLKKTQPKGEATRTSQKATLERADSSA